MFVGVYFADESGNQMVFGFLVGAAFVGFASAVLMLMYPRAEP